MVAWEAKRRRVSGVTESLSPIQVTNANQVWKKNLPYSRRLKIKVQRCSLTSHLRKRWSRSSNAWSQRQHDCWTCKPHIDSLALVGSLSRCVIQKWKAWRGIAPLNHTLAVHCWVGALGRNDSHVCLAEKWSSSISLAHQRNSSSGAEGWGK